MTTNTENTTATTTATSADSPTSNVAEEEVVAQSSDANHSGNVAVDDDSMERGTLTRAPNSKAKGIAKTETTGSTSTTEGESTTSFFKPNSGEKEGGNNGIVPVAPPIKKLSSSIVEKTASVVNVPPARLPIMGGTANRKELTFVISAGILLAFNSGYINGSCLSGLLTPHHVTRSVAGFTGSYTNSALELAENGASQEFAIGIGMIFSFLVGSIVAGLLTPNATAYRIEPTYGPTFLLGGVALLVASILAATEHDESLFFNFAAAANGIQNAISSSYSSNLIRTCHLTGTTTDIGLFLGQALRGNLKNLWKLCVLSSLAVSFWIGGIVSFYVTREFTSYSLLFNSGLFLLIGISLITFLVHELHITVKAAMCGTWQWKQALEKLSLSLRVEKFASSRHLNDGSPRRGGGNFAEELIDLFDVIDLDGNGEITEDELLTALNAAGVKIKRKEVKVLMRLADTDNDGTISREEWINIARVSMKGAGSLSASIKGSIHNRKL